MSATVCHYSSSELVGFLEIKRKPLMAILSSYWDESGKFKDHKTISFCGLCLSSGKLEKFEENWKELLRRNGLSYLKVSDALNAHHQLSPIIPAQTVRERIDALKPFVSCLTQWFELGVAVGVGVEAFQRTAEHLKRRISGGENPFYLAFKTALILFAEYRKADDTLVIVFDDDEETAKHCLNLYRKMKIEDTSLRSAFASITFADDKVYLPLQAADLLAGLVRLECALEFSGTPYIYKSLYEYLAEIRGPGSIRWQFHYIGEQEMAKIELLLKKRR
jgi:hypothetical protein